VARWPDVAQEDQSFSFLEELEMLLMWEAKFFQQNIIKRKQKLL